MHQPMVSQHQMVSDTTTAGGAPGGSSLAGIMWRRKGVMLFMIALGLAGGYVFFTQQDETFQAGATFEVVHQQTDTGTDSAVEQVTDVAPNIAFIYAELTSDEVLRSAVEIGALTSFSETPGSPEAVMAMLRRDLQLHPAIEGAESKERSIVQVLFESKDPTVATAVVNAVVQAYEEYVNGRHTAKVKDIIAFFEDGKNSIVPKLEDLDKEYTAFRNEAPLEWNGSGEAVNPFREDARVLEDTLHTYETELRQLTTKLRLIEEASKGKTDAITVLREVQFLLGDVASVTEMKEAIANAPNEDVDLQLKLLNIRVEAELLSKQYAPNHPLRQAVEDRLAATQRELEQIQQTKRDSEPERVDVGARQEEAAVNILKSYVNGMQKKQLLLKEDIQEVTTRLDAVRTRARELIAFENENASYTRRIARYQEMLDAFDSQLEKANIPMVNNGLEVNVLRPAGMAALVGPLLSRSLLMGGFIGFVLGGLLGFLVDWSERTFRSPDEIAQTLDLPILTHLPLMLIRKKKATENLEFDAIDKVITVVHDPHSPGAEAIRSVRTSLFATPTKDAEYQVIQVTSALPGDGKSTVAANLAASVAKANKRVLIIDADLRRPTQGSIFGVNPEQGLTSTLNADCRPMDAIVETQIPGLFLMSTGPKPNNPAEALMLPEFGQMIDDLRPEFDMIIIDTPPMLAVTDASNVATHVDGVMFVMRIGRNVKPMSKRAVTMLKHLHVNLIGVVVNAIGDSGYSSTYANAWSDSYGGQPGSEYGYGYYRYGSDRYLNASKGQSVTVRGRSDNRKARVLDASHSSSGNGRISDAGVATVERDDDEN